MSNPTNPPIVCDMTTAPDTLDERLAAYKEVFGTHLIGRERTESGIRFRLRAANGVADRVRSLAALEKACCAFFDFTVTETGDEVIWDASVVDDPIAREILDEYYLLPDTVTDDPKVLFDRFADKGLTVVLDDHGTYRPATDEEIGIAR